MVGEKVGHGVDDVGHGVVVGIKVGYLVALFSSLGEEAAAGEAVIKEVGLVTLSTSDCVGAVDKERVVKDDDFVMHSSLLT